MSKGEEKIQSILSKYRCHYVKEKTFPDLKGKKGQLLRYDFAIYDLQGTLKFLCEFDGQQHFSQIKHFQKTKKQYLNSLENDRKKNRYAITKGIPLYRIPYWDIENINTLADLLRPQYKVKTIYHNDDLIFQRR